MSWKVKSYHRDLGPFGQTAIDDFFSKYADIEVLAIDIDDDEPVDITFYYRGSNDPHGPACTDSDSQLYDDLCNVLDSD